MFFKDQASDQLPSATCAGEGYLIDNLQDLLWTLSVCGHAIWIKERTIILHGHNELDFPTILQPVRCGIYR